jgi:hypothetical protein
MLDLPVCALVGPHGLVHVDVIVVTEVYKFFSDELSVIVSNDGIRDPEAANGIPNEIYGLLGADLS